MEPESSVVLESCGEDAMLMQTVKNIVTQEGRNELESEEEGFFVVTDVRTMPNINVTAEDSTVNQIEERITWSDLCRVCANVNDHLIPIFDGEGLQHELCNKIHKYLPIHVSENDTLPLQLCYHCAATLLAWHELSEGCLNAERRLLEMQDTLQDKNQYFNASPSDGLEASTQDTITIPNATESLPRQRTPAKDEISAESAINDTDRFKRKILDDRSPTFHNFHNAYEAFLETRKNQKSTPRKSRSIRTVDLKARDVSPVNETPCDNAKRRLPVRTYGASSKLSQPNKSTLQDTQTINEKENKNICVETIPKPVDKTCESRLNETVVEIDYSEPCLKEKQDANRKKGRKKVDDDITCEVCQKKFKLRGSYKSHMLVHTGEKPCECYICGKRFSRNGSLQYHLGYVHNGKRHSCTVCGKTFFTKTFLQDHEKTHTSDYQFMCDSCGKTFGSYSLLRMHVKTHNSK